MRDILLCFTGIQAKNWVFERPFPQLHDPKDLDVNIQINDLFNRCFIYFGRGKLGTGRSQLRLLRIRLSTFGAGFESLAALH